MNKYKPSSKQGPGRRDWRRDQPEPPAQRINAYMLEDPMYEYMEEKKRREKQERIDQLKALLESSTDSSSESSSDETKKESSKTKRKKKQRKKKTKKKKDENDSEPEPKSKRKKRSQRRHSQDDIEWVDAALQYKDDTSQTAKNVNLETEPITKCDIKAGDHQSGAKTESKSHLKHKKSRKQKKQKSRNKHR